MTSKILKSILSVAVAVLLATLLVITGVLYQYFGGVQQSQLKDEEQNDQCRNLRRESRNGRKPCRV